MFTVVGGTASRELAKKIAKWLDCKYVDSKTTIFPDGERKTTLLGIPRGNTLVVQSTPPPVDSNLIQLLSLISKAKQTSSKVTAIVPYMGYMRQDIEFLPREIITSRILASMIRASGASEVITVDIHSEIAMGYFTVPIKNVSAVHLLARHFTRSDLKNPIVISPDLFWEKHAKKFAGMLDADYIALNKKRDRRTGKLSITNRPAIDLFGRDVIILDDMMSTGMSAALASKYAKQHKCRRVFAACTHPLLVGGAEKLLKKAGVRTIVSTNSIPHKSNRIDISGILADAVLGT